MMTEKLNLTKTYPEYYKAKLKPQMVSFEPYQYLAISGNSAPEDQRFIDAVGLLYKAAFTMKKVVKVQSLDFVVPKLEAFWWVESGIPFGETPRSDWHWQLLLRMPDFVGPSEFEQAKDALSDTAPNHLLSSLKLEELHEGLSAQILHLGSYEEEADSLQKLFQFIEKEGFIVSGKHHEIYLNDPSKNSPEKLKTILRYSIS